MLRIFVKLVMARPRMQAKVTYRLQQPLQLRIWLLCGLGHWSNLRQWKADGTSGNYRISVGFGGSQDFEAGWWIQDLRSGRAILNFCQTLTGIQQEHLGDGWWYEYVFSGRAAEVLEVTVIPHPFQHRKTTNNSNDLPGGKPNEVAFDQAPSLVDSSLVRFSTWEIVFGSCHSRVNRQFLCSLSGSQKVPFSFGQGSPAWKSLDR